MLIKFRKKLCTCVTNWQKIGTFSHYLSMYWTNVHQIFSVGRHECEIINLVIVLRSINTRCYGNQLIWGQIKNTD